MNKKDKAAVILAGMMQGLMYRQYESYFPFGMDKTETGEKLLSTRARVLARVALAAADEIEQSK